MSTGQMTEVSLNRIVPLPFAVVTGSVDTTSSSTTASRPAQLKIDLRLLTGLLGVLLASLAAGLNGNLVDIALGDVRGALGMSYDAGSWLSTAYQATQVTAMAFAPWCAVTFSLRRFTLAAIGALVLLGVLCPLAPNYPILLGLRTLQGLAAGCLPPVLMTVALRFLPPRLKLFGLAGYALTATFGPNLGVPLAAFWTEYFGWQLLFWQVLPLGLFSLVAVSWGIPQDPLHLERFRQFDWLGLLTGFPAICCLVIAILQGERLDWLNSPLIATLLGAGIALLVVFFTNEKYHSLPFFSLDILHRRNFTHALITLAAALVVLSSAMVVPAGLLAALHDYRPLQTTPMALLVALPQLLVLPVIAALCNLRWVDCRWILALGLILCLLSCLGGLGMTADWTRENFYGVLALQILGQPMVVFALLMSATSVVSAQEGSVASAWFNTVKGFSAVVGTGIVTNLTSSRTHVHFAQLVDQLGNDAVLSAQSALLLSAAPQPVLAQLVQQVNAQAHVLAAIDIYTTMAVLTFALIVLIPFVAQRVFPPAEQSTPTAAPSRSADSQALLHHA
jgi:DHA2 family multidrug resistance protein